MKFREKENEEEIWEKKKKRKSVSRRNLTLYLTFNWTNIEYIVIEIFLKERKKIKKEKNRRRPFIVLSENSQRNSCHASRALEGNGSDARRTSTAKRIGKRGKKERKKYGRTIDFPQNRISSNSIELGSTESRRKILGGERAATGNRTCIVSYHNPEHAMPEAASERD